MWSPEEHRRPGCAIGSLVRATAPGEWELSPGVVARSDHEGDLSRPRGVMQGRRRVLLLDVTQVAARVGELIHEARDVNLPVEPGVRDGRDALVRWAVMLDEVIP